MNRFAKTAGVLIMFLLAISAIFSCGEPRDGDSVTLTGTLRIVGNEPFTAMALFTGDNRQIRFSREDRERLKEHLLKPVTVSGTFRVKELKSADGRVFKEFYLENPVIKE